MYDTQFKATAFFDETTVWSFMSPISWDWFFLCMTCLSYYSKKTGRCMLYYSYIQGVDRTLNSPITCREIGFSRSG
jgi:hypothetical protein